MKKKGNKKMPTPRYKLIHNPIPTSLFCLKFRLFVVNALGKEKTSSHRINYIHEIHYRLERSKDVGMGL